jgi:hypothetical protein
MLQPSVPQNFQTRGGFGAVAGNGGGTAVAGKGDSVVVMPVVISRIRRSSQPPLVPAEAGTQLCQANKAFPAWLLDSRFRANERANSSRQAAPKINRLLTMHRANFAG